MGSLATTNKYLSSAAKRQKAVRLSIRTSSAIEGIHAPFKSKRGKVAKQANKRPIAAPKSSAIKPARRAKTA